MKYLIVGLGNPGPEYEITRHNIGFLVLDRLADMHGATFSPDRHGDTSTIKYKGRSFYLLKPNTYMNLSGKAIQYHLTKLKLNKERLLVIVDDLALPFGSIRLRPKGSAAGHNGLKSIEQLTGGSDYPRVRFGIGSNYPKGQQVDYVLSPFTQEEFDEITPLIDKAIKMIYGFTTIGINKTMTEFND